MVGDGGVGMARAVSPRRRTAFRVCSAVFGLALGTVLFGWVSLVTGWFEGGERTVHRVHDLGYGVIAGIILAGGCLAQLRRPEERIAAMQQIGLGVAAFVVAIPLAVDFTAPMFLGIGIFALIAVVLAWLHPARDLLLRSPARPSPVLAVFTVAAAGPLLAYAWRMAQAQRLGLATDSHIQEHHWTTMAAMAIALLLVAGLASLRTRGWPIPAGTAALGAIVFGVASAVFPTYAGSAGRTWGALAAGGGLLFGLAAAWQIRREPVRGG